MLEWVFRRCEGAAQAVETPIGRLPAPGALHTEGLDLSDEDLSELLRVDDAAWRDELPPLHEHFATFGDRLPVELRAQLEALTQRLGS